MIYSHYPLIILHLQGGQVVIITDEEIKRYKDYSTEHDPHLTIKLNSYGFMSNSTIELVERVEFYPSSDIVFKADIRNFQTVHNAIVLWSKTGKKSDEKTTKKAFSANVLI